MPIDKTWGEEEKEEYVAQITELRHEVDLVDTADGATEIPRIYIDLSDVDPNVVSRFPLRFRASKHRNASWIKFLNAIEHVGFKCKQDPNSLIGMFVHLREEPESSEINGEQVSWIFPRPLEATPSEERAQEIFEGLPKKAAPTAQYALDLEDEAELISLYKGVKKNDKNFLDMVEPPEGMTAEEALTLVKERLG